MGWVNYLVSILWLQDVKQMPVWVYQTMPFTCAARPRLSSAVCIGFVVFFLEALPVAELVLPLNDHACHGFAVAGLDAAPPLRLSLDSRAKDKAAGPSLMA